MDLFDYSESGLRTRCEELAAEVVSGLKASGRKLACAESCTGGLLASFITGVSGASEVFEFGAVTYSERMKASLLGIPPQLISECGVVSSEVALAMAYGSKLYSQSDIGVGITGIAGPNGGTQDMPVGTVWISVADSEKEITYDIKAYEKAAMGREQIRLYACAEVLTSILSLIG